MNLALKFHLIFNPILTLNFFQLLRIKNPELFYFGLICLIFSLVCLVLVKFHQVQVAGINAWIKPFKFAFSTFLYSWAMAWFCSYLKDFHLQAFNWGIIILLGFEIIYIAIQAAKVAQYFNLDPKIAMLSYSNFTGSDGTPRKDR